MGHLRKSEYDLAPVSSLIIPLARIALEVDGLKRSRLTEFALEGAEVGDLVIVHLNEEYDDSVRLCG